MKYSECLTLNQLSRKHRLVHVFDIYFICHFYYRRNSIQNKEKIDKVYRTLQDWLSCLITTPKKQVATSIQQTTTLKPQTTTEKNTAINLSVSEFEDFLCRLCWLFDKSNYHEQILLMQTAPVEWGREKIEQFFHCTSHQARTAVFQRTAHGDFSEPVDNRGNKSFDTNVAQVIQDFYVDDEISRQSPNTKDTRTPKDIGTVVIRYMTMSIGETFELFKSKYPNVKVSRSKFHALRPSWVREDCPHQVCMCIHHQNIDLLLAVSK
jgi:hypothetical protein